MCVTAGGGGEPAAVTIASWWAAPSNPALTELATGAPTNAEAICDDIARERRGSNVTGIDSLALDTLATWAINFEPVKSPAVMETIDAAYLPLVIQEAAGIPLDPSFEEQKNIMLRCKGLFYACKDGAEARRFNRLLIDAGMIKGL